jgi:hypothetical protein
VIAQTINRDFLSNDEIRASLQIMCATHNGAKERSRHAEANRKGEVFHRGYAYFLKAKRQASPTKIQKEIDKFKDSRTDVCNLFACHPLADWERF